MLALALVLDGRSRAEAAMARGVGAAWVVPKADAWSMNLHLQEISRQVTPGTHAVIDGSGWHQTGGKLRIPGNISLLHLPPYSPELNPQKNVWQYLRQKYLANRIYEHYEAIWESSGLVPIAAHLDLVLPDEVNPEIAKSALTQARQRLGQAPLAQLFAMSATCWDERHQNGRTWRGLTRYAVDGSTLRTSDSEENRAHFGAQAYA